MMEDYVHIFFTTAFLVALLRHTYTDMREMLLYDSVNWGLAVLGLLRALYYGMLTEALLGALLLLAIMLSIYLLSHGGMGEGDVKLAAVLGLWLCTEQGVACLVVAFILGAAIGLLLLATGICGRHQALPFGPYLCCSAVFMYFHGSQLLNWYWSYL